VVKLTAEVDDLRDNIFYFIKNLDESSVEASGFYINILSHLQDMSQSLEYISKVCHKHINNNHKKLKFNQVRELKEIDDKLEILFSDTEKAFKAGSFEDIGNIISEKKEVYEMKYKTLYKEFDRLNQKVRIDFNQVKQREKELESKLELVVMDSDSQVQTRDMKILELKRKIDSLEFNMENSSIRELKHREDKSKLEERLAKIMKTLRGSIQLIEDDLEVLETDNTTDLD